MKEELYSILTTLGLPPSSQKIYRELLERGESTARLLSVKLSLTRPSTYDHLDILVKKGFVVEKKKDNKTYFAAENVRHIEHKLTDTIDRLKEQKDVFVSMLPSLLKESSATSPLIRFYEGKEGLSHLLHDILWCKGETIHTMWPHEEIGKVLDRDFLIRFNDKRIREKIKVHALWPHSMKPKESYIWKDKDVLVERKYAPSGMQWKMGYTIYGDKVSFISSAGEIFGFIIQSKEFAALMKLQFDLLWSVAKKK